MQSILISFSLRSRIPDLIDPLGPPEESSVEGLPTHIPAESNDKRLS